MTPLFAPIGTRIHRFWFRPVTASGFGLMRMAFGATTLLNMAMQWRNVQRYYGPHGILPQEFVGLALRKEWRFSLLDNIQAWGTDALYWLLLLTLALVMIGYGTRIILAVSLFLLFSFHEYGIVLLDGGDSLLHIIGFILFLSPCYKTFTIHHLVRKLRKTPKKAAIKRPPPVTMPIWPYRLLLWQMVWIYATAAYYKMGGVLWYSGSAVAVVMHHGLFARLPVPVADALSFLSPTITWFTVFSQLAWVLLLLFPMLAWIGLRIPTGGLKRFLIVCGILVHGGIMLTMDVGTFSLAVFVSYCGLLLDEDFLALRRWREKIRGAYHTLRQWY